MKNSICACGSGRAEQECCSAAEAPEDVSGAVHEFEEGEIFLLYRELGDMRRQMKELVSGRSPTEATVDPEIDRQLVVFDANGTDGPSAAPLWQGRRLTRELLAYPGREWDDQKGAVLQEKLYLLSEAFGDYLLGALHAQAERVTEYEAVVEWYSDYLLMYYLMTPLEVKPGHQAARRFLGNYYARTFLDANIDTVYLGLTALPAYYAYLYRLGLVSRAAAEAILQECSDWPWYRRRFEDYQAVAAGDGRSRARWCREFDYKSMPVG